MYSEKVHVVNHPLLSHKLTILRDKDTPTKDFRELVSEIGMLLTYEATRDLPLAQKEVETPICKTMAPTLKGKKFAVVPILRAGLGLVEGVLRMVPSARVGHIGLYRNEETLEPVKYFCKMPKDIAERDVLIVDPSRRSTRTWTSTAARWMKSSTSMATLYQAWAMRGTGFSEQSRVFIGVQRSFLKNWMGPDSREGNPVPFGCCEEDQSMVDFCQNYLPCIQARRDV